MSRTATKPQLQIVDFQMPPVEPGQTVLWSYWPGEKASPAIVLSIGQRTVNLSVHVEQMHDHVLKTGVRHRDDPFLKASPQHDSGVWELTSRDKRINAVLERFEASEE